MSTHFEKDASVHNDITTLIRLAAPVDVSTMVALSDQKRRFYEKAQPQFWCRSKNANESQTK